MIKAILVFCMAFIAPLLRASTVYWGETILDIDSGDEWCGLYACYGDIDGTSIDIGLCVRYYCNAILGYMSAYDEPNAGLAMNWRKMSIGDEVSKSTMTGSDKDYFYANWINDNTGAPVSGWFSINPGESVYVAYFARLYGENYTTGWVELIHNGTDIVGGQSAVDITGSPLIIRPRDVPEPSSVLLILLGVCACAVRRKAI